MDMTRVENEEAERIAMAAIWSDVLATPLVGLDDNFFALGGDSMALMTLLMRIEETYGVYLEQEAVFEAPTPRALSVIVQAQRAA